MRDANKSLEDGRSLDQSLAILETPEGILIDTHIRGIEMINYGTVPETLPTTAPILLPPNLAKDDISIGTRVFLVRRDREHGAR